MTREGKWPLAAIVAAAFAAALLAACGGSDSDSTSSTATTEGASTAPTTSTTARAGGEAPQRGSEERPGKDRSGGREKAGSSNEGSQGRQSPGGDVTAPLRVSGGGSAQFQYQTGDNSIQEFGEEAESELQEVAEIVHGFYAARVEAKWDVACGYLAKSNIEQLEQLAQQAPKLRNAGCAPVLRAFTRSLTPAVSRAFTTVDAGSFRREGEQGFLMYYGSGHTPYAMPMHEEGGAWKVAALSATALS